MPTLSTHVLDTVRGEPAAGVAVQLRSYDNTVIATAATDSDGRVARIAEVFAGFYRLAFDTGGYFGETFYPEVIVTFEVTHQPHYHVPLLLSPFGYSTYRGT